jgi:hypothetical protein
VADRVLHAEPAGEELDRDEARTDHHEQRVEAELLVARDDVDVALDDHAVEAKEVDPREQHE